MASAGAVVVGVAFGMARYAYGLTMPVVSDDLGLSSAVAGVVAGLAFAGYLVTLLLVAPLSARLGPRVTTLVGSVCVVVGAGVAAVAPGAPVLAAGVAVAGAASALVWSPFSDLVVRAAPPARHATLLAVVTTGTAAGLVIVGLMALVVLPVSWRWVWVGIAVAGVAALLYELATVPRPDRLPHAGAEGAEDHHYHPPRTRLPWRRLLAPVGFAVVYFGGTIVYFSYATEAARSQGLPDAFGPLLFVVLGVTGASGVLAGRAATRLGDARLGGCCLLGVGAAMLLLALASGSPVLTLLSAAVFGPGFMAGSALTAIWTARLAPQRAGDAFTVALLAGATSSVGWPAAVGALTGALGLSTLLAGLGVALAAVGGLLLASPRPGDGPSVSRRGARPRSNRRDPSAPRAASGSAHASR